MTRYRVFDEETASLLHSRTNSESIDLVQTGEYFAADAGEVILAPSVKAGDVLYIRIRGSLSAPVSSTEPELSELPAETEVPVTDPFPATPPSETKRHYVATGILGLDGEVDEETPEAPKPWWKKLFLD